MQGLQSAPSVMNNAAMFSGQIQSGLATEMNNAQAQDARSNWWVQPVTGAIGAGLGAVTGGLSDMAMNASSSSGGTGSGGGGLGMLGTALGNV